MAEKKKGIPFKELPKRFKVLRILTLCLMLPGIVMSIVGTALGIGGIGILLAGLFTFAIPAIVIAIIDFKLEANYKKELESKKPSEPQEEVKQEPQPKVNEIKSEPTPEPKPIKEEPVSVPIKEKKSKKGLIIGLSVGGGCLLLTGLIVGGIFGIGAIVDAIGERGGSKDYLPSDYVFSVPYGTVDYETEDATTGFVFYENKNIRVYHWCYSQSYKDYRIYEIKEGTYTYTQSTQTINVSLNEYQFYGTNWTVHYYEVPEELTFKIKSTEKMVYSASNISDTIVKKVSTFKNSTSTKYTGS